MTIRQYIAHRLARLRVFKRLAAVERVLVTSIDIHEKHGKQIEAVANVLLAHTTCSRCGAMHHKSSTRKMATPGGRIVLSCLWCVSLLASRGYTIVKDEVAEA